MQVAFRKQLDEEVEIQVQGGGLKAEIISKNMTMKELAKRLGISRTTLWRKINNPNMFTLADIRAISSVLKLNRAEVASVFFNEEVS